MTPRELFLLAPHLRLWNAQIEKAKAAYDLAPIATCRRCMTHGVCNHHRKAQ